MSNRKNHRRQLGSGMERTLGLLSAMNSGLAMNQGAGTGAHKIKRAKTDRKAEMRRAMKQGWGDDE